MATVNSGRIPEKICIRNGKGELLVGLYTDAGSTELAILCHGHRSSKDLLALKNLSAALIDIGISTYRFDFSGNGESEGEYSYGGFWKEADDLHSVVLYWKSQGLNVNYIIGHSKGGNCVLLYASKYGDVPNVINCAGRCALERGLKSRFGDDFLERIEREGYLDAEDKNEKYKVTKESLFERLYHTDMRVAARSISPTCNVLTVHGDEDERVSVENAYEFDTLIPNHTLKIIKGPDHVFTSHQEELKKTVVDFIKSRKGITG